VICQILNGHISATGHSIHFMLYGRVFEVGGSNGTMSGLIKSKVAARRWRPWHDV